MVDAQFLGCVVVPRTRSVGKRKIAEVSRSYCVALRSWNDIPRILDAGRWVLNRDQRSGRSFGLGKVARFFERRRHAEESQLVNILQPHIFHRIEEVESMAVWVQDGDLNRQRSADGT